MSKLFNLAKMTTLTTGTGTITLYVAVPGYLTFALSGVQNGDVVSYGISDGANSEVGYGTYSSSGPTLARTTILKSTNSDAAINLSGSAMVFITALAENILSESLASKTTPVDADTLAISDSAASGVGKSVTWANIKATLLVYFYTIFPNKDGWMPGTGTWTYASATTITVPSGAAAIYSVGDKWKVTANGVVLQGYITVVVDTLLTVVGDALTNHVFSLNYYSKGVSPVGFTHWFNWTPVWTLSGGTLTTTYTTQEGKFCIKGREVTATFKLVLNVVSTATANKAFQLTVPVALVNTGVDFVIGSALCRDSGTDFTGLVVIPLGASELRFMSNAAGTTDYMAVNPAKTLATADTLMGTIVYQI